MAITAIVFASKRTKQPARTKPKGFALAALNRRPCIRPAMVRHTLKIVVGRRTRRPRPLQLLEIAPGCLLTCS